MKIVFFGTPPFAAKLLKAVIDHGQGLEVVAIISKPDKPQGRSQKLQSSAVKEMTLAEAPHIPLFQPDVVSSPEFAPTLAALKADIFLVIAYGEIIKQHLLDMPLLACINVHGSILPKYRGAAPIQRAILDGEKESGVTIMHMVKKMDAGDMIRIVKVPIGPDTTYGELQDQLCEASVKPLLDVLSEYQKGMTPACTPQNLALVTFAPKIELEDCEIHWQRSAQELHNLIRGVNPEPGAWCYATLKGEKKKIKIFRSSLIEGLTAAPSTVLEYKKSKIVIACGDHALQILELQPEGKKRMTAAEFINGVAVGDICF
jgi:methionyl-tRNA formyltransferase